MYDLMTVIEAIISANNGPSFKDKVNDLESKGYRIEANCPGSDTHAAHATASKGKITFFLEENKPTRLRLDHGLYLDPNQARLMEEFMSEVFKMAGLSFSKLEADNFYVRVVAPE